MTGWDDDQTALVIAAQQLRADIGPHGHPMTEATSPLADPARRGPGTYRYVAHVKKDFAAAALARAQNERAETYKGMDLSGDVWTVEKVWNE